MRLGIDVDDTITNSWESLMPHYATCFDVPLKELQQSKPYYKSVQHKVTLDEYFDMVLSIYDSVIPNVPLKEHAKEVINKLYDEGYEIIFITARGRGHTDPYKQTKDYLDKHCIKYHKIIVDATDKAKVCQQEKIDLFIDDSLRNCKIVSQLGIETILFERYYNEDDQQFHHVKSWNEIYEYIKSRW